MKEFEKIVLIGCPWLFGVVLATCGIYVGFKNPERLHGILMGCSGLICMSIYCLCSLVSKLIAKNKE
ncbi:hypothetical protein KKG61_05290 [bacterium]|nr:hypothetical protein [bacterium]MBU1599501.1 hypothetical protein [bacterium]